VSQRVKTLTSAGEIDRFLADHAVAVIFKAGMCHRSDAAYDALQSTLGARPDLAFAVIPVVEARPASNHLAERTGVRHESPQLLVFRDGSLVMSRNHWDITAEALEAALEEASAPA